MAAVNNNSSVVVIGRTTPVPSGQQTSAKSLPVVIASDQSAIPVEEQNKQQSEVALSLLGIPRSEVALGIFADVNTYDVNPTEWTAFPEQFTSLNQYGPDGSTLLEKYEGYGGNQDWGLTHIAEEAGAMIEAPSDEYSILTSKRFFRYQPGRVSAATFGVKINRGPYSITKNDPTFDSVRNQSLKKYGIFDKFDGYYFESRNDGYGDNFSCIRRTQSIIRDNPLPFSSNADYQSQDYAWAGVPQVESETPTYPHAYEVLKANKRFLQEVAADFINTETNSLDGLDVDAGGTAPSVYQPTAANYDPATGNLTLTITNGHGHQIGDTVLLQPESLRFTCTSGPTIKSYPRASGEDGTGIGTSTSDNRGKPDPAYNNDLKIIAETASTITINVGTSSDTAAHTFVSADADAVTVYSAQNAEYDKCRRDSGLVIEGILHDLKYGGNASTVFNTLRFFNKSDLDNIRLYVDDPAIEVARYTAVLNSISDIFGLSNEIYFTPGPATTYNPATGDLTLDIGTNNLVPGLRVQLAPNSLTFTCALDPSKEKTYPRASGEDGTLVNPGSNNNIGKPDPAYNTAVEITARTATTITVKVGTSSDTSAHTFVSADADAVKAYQPTYFTPQVSGTSYDPATGLLVLNIGSHSIQPGTSVLLQPESLGFTCTSDSNTVTKLYPRASGENGIGIGTSNSDNTGKADPAYNRGVRVESVTATTITIDVGTSSDTADHTFVSADPNAVIAFAPTAPYLSPLRGYSAYAGISGTLPSVENGAYSVVSGLINILTTALTGTGNYSSIPDPVGSAAGEMCIYRDGLVMTHAAAFDPSLLKEKTSYQIISLFNDNVNLWMRIKIPRRAELLQLGQGIYFNKNASTNNVRDGSENVLPDGSIWHVFAVGNITSDNFGVYQEVRLSKHPNNEEIYTAVGGGSTSNSSNPWVNNSTKAYPDAEEFVIEELVDENDVLIPFSAGSDTLDISASGFTLQTPVPFLLPDDSRKYKGQNYTDGSLNDQANSYSDGAFPYLYPSGATPDDTNASGYIDSTLGGSTGISTLKQQFNYVNKRLYKNWVWFNVDPRYYKVYEYRVPRSRMSGEKLNGITTDIVYSDNVLDKRAGDPVQDPTTQEQLQFESVWDLDPTKVTMYKIEFSWYGAVGATFLAYVPVGNGEARWVRVHHLRASNQLKVASLGNATLPITYMVYGGGSQNRYGYQNSDRKFNNSSGYGSLSEQLVKYGASYYIDGGDRGTVRLFSYASETLKEIGGSKYLIQASQNPNLFDSANTKLDVAPGSTYVNAPAITIANTNGAPPISDYYINARVITGSAIDQDIRVVWADSSNGRLYLSRNLTATTGDISLVVDRSQPLVGIKCRREINGVRNRVQIYPTRLATGLTNVSESVAIQLIKSPLFQTFDVPESGASISVNSAINIGKRGKKIILPSTDITETGTYLLEGQKTYGYFRYTLVNDTSGVASTALGLLEKTDGEYYFSASEVSINELNIRGTFLRIKNWSGPGPSDPDLTTTVENSTFNGFFTSSLSRLSAVAIDTEQRSPIPGTGTVVTTLFAPNTGEQYELQPYFDYNKDYLSFPLTDLVDSLYVCASSKSFYNDGDGTGSYGKRAEILASLTWEEQ